MNKVKNLTIKGSDDKPITLDLLYAEEQPKPLVIYAHGFNGFKDWGNFDLIAEEFAQNGFTFLKFNFSHNGTTPEKPEEFADLELYAQNNYSRELEDLAHVIDFVANEANPFAGVIDRSRIFLLGHSMGGGIVLVKGSEDRRVKGIACWASVGALTTPWGKWSPTKMQSWQKNRVEYIQNSRTGQNMPLDYQLYKDYEQNRERLNVEKAVENLQIPVLFCHGTEDAAVPVETAEKLASLNPRSSLYILESDHVFGRKHPWSLAQLPDATQAVVNKTLDFFRLLV